MSNSDQVDKFLELVAHMKTAKGITFILGAGASKSGNIPMAKGLIDDAKRQFPHVINKDNDEYGAVMGALTPDERQSILQPHLNKSKVNFGHLALASIFHGNAISAGTRRVLSFNFDFLFERASALLGKHIPVYDFAVAPSTKIHLLADQALVHLHGQSYGLRMLNSGQETEGHAANLQRLLEDSVQKHLTIVAGYSGLADAVCPEIIKAFDSSNRLFWLGYETNIPSHLKDLFAKQYAVYIPGCDFDETMMFLADKLGCWPPTFLGQPFQHALLLLEELAALENWEGKLQDLKDVFNEYNKEWDS